MSRRRAPRSRPLRVAHVATIDLTLWFMLREQLRGLRKDGYEVFAISAPGDRVADLEADGVRHIAWNSATRGWNLVADLRAFFELFRILRRERFDVVHTHNPKPGVLGRIAARLAGVPCVVNTQHGLYATPEDRFARKAAVLAVEWVAARFSDAELFQSEEDLVWAARLGIARAPKAALLGNGIDLERFDPGSVPSERIEKLRADLGIPDGALVIGTVGRLVAEKGYRELFEAAARVRSVHPEALFLVVGGADTDKWDSLSPEELNGAREHTIFAGHRDDVHDLLALTDVFVLPSWREGLPRSAIEAAAMAKPLVLTDIRGCREVVRDGVEGLLVPPRNAARLAEAIDRLAGDGDLRRRFGAAAKERARERFDEQRVVEKVIETYRNALGRKRGAAPGGRLVVLRGDEDNPARLRRAVPADAAWLARLHTEALPNAFLPTLGKGFMRRLYRGLIDDPGGVVLVVEQGGRRIGMASGVASVPAFYRRFFRRHGVQAAIAAGPRLLKPSVLQHMRETASYPSMTTKYPDAEFLTWNVEPEGRGKGLGVLLSNEMVSALAAHGTTEIKAFAYADNETLNHVFTKTGWERRGQIKVHRDGQLSTLWVIECPSPSPSPSPSASHSS